MTEEQIINCLNDTVGKEHIGIYCTDKNGNFTTVIKLTDIVDFINRQKAEIDELTKVYKSLKSEKNAELEQKTMDVESLTTERDALYETIAEQKAEIEQKDIEINLLIEKKEAAYDEISGLKAEFERLQGINEILESAFVAECDLSACPRKKEIRDEAIEDALNRVKKRIGDSHFQNYGLAIMEIMDVEKEMEGAE